MPMSGIAIRAGWARRVIVLSPARAVILRFAHPDPPQNYPQPASFGPFCVEEESPVMPGAPGTLACCSEAGIYNKPAILLPAVAFV